MNDIYTQEVNVRYLHQWYSNGLAPKSFMVNYENYNAETGWLFGGGLVGDIEGVEQNVNVFGKMSYGLQLSRKNRIFFGFNLSMVNRRLNGSKLEFVDNSDKTRLNTSFFALSGGLSAVIYLDDYFYGGFSILNALDFPFTSSSDEIGLSDQRIYSVNAGYKLFFGDNFLALNTWGRYTRGLKIQGSGNLTYNFRERYYIGFGGSTSGSGNILAGLLLSRGYNAENLLIGYTFTNYFTGFGPVFGSSHEITFHYALE